MIRTAPRPPLDRHNQKRKVWIVIVECPRHPLVVLARHLPGDHAAGIGDNVIRAGKADTPQIGHGAVPARTPNTPAFSAWIVSALMPRSFPTASTAVAASRFARSAARLSAASRNSTLLREARPR